MRAKLLAIAIAGLFVCAGYAEGHDYYYRGGYYGHGWGGGYYSHNYYGHGWGGYYGHRWYGSPVSINVGYISPPAVWAPTYWNPPYYYTSPVVVTSPVMVSTPVTTVYRSSSSDSNTFYKPLFTNSASTTESSVLTKAQARLINLGYYKGSVDGNFGPATMRAVQTFQSENGLPTTGRLDLQTLRKLGINV